MKICHFRVCLQLALDECVSMGGFDPHFAWEAGIAAAPLIIESSFADARSDRLRKGQSGDLDLGSSTLVGDADASPTNSVGTSCLPLPVVNKTECSERLRLEPS